VPDPTPTQEANAAGEYLAALLNRGVYTEHALRLTTAWILSRGNEKAVDDAIGKLERDEPWKG
jgi:hypothetical protein